MHIVIGWYSGSPPYDPKVVFLIHKHFFPYFLANTCLLFGSKFIPSWTQDIIPLWYQIICSLQWYIVPCTKQCFLLGPVYSLLGRYSCSLPCEPRVVCLVHKHCIPSFLAKTHVYSQGQSSLSFVGSHVTILLVQVILFITFFSPLFSWFHKLRMLCLSHCIVKTRTHEDVNPWRA